MFIKKTYQQIYITIFLLFLSYSPLASDTIQLIKDIGLSRGDNGEGIVTIILPNQDIVPDIEKQTDKIIVNLPNTELPKQLNKEINGTDSKTPITKVTSFASKEQTTLHIATLADYNYSFYQQNNTLVITLWDVNKQPQNFSANYSNTDIRIILKALSDHNTKLNLVATDSVQGKMTLRTKNMHWEQALDIVLKANGLAKRKEGNILIVAPAGELLEHSRRSLPEPASSNPKPSDLRRELITINYADAKTIIEAFKQQKAKQGEDITCQRGALIFDKRTNTIIAYQTQENLKLLNKIVNELDIPGQQVRLSVYVIEINKDYIPLIKDQFNQGKNIDLLINNMEKEGHGEIISHPRMTAADKEKVLVLRGQEVHCQLNPNGCQSPIISITITPEIINDSQKLLVDISLKRTKNQESSIEIKKQFKKVVNNNQTIILDELDDLGYTIKKGSPLRLMLIITPSIVDQKELKAR